tara:strand:+ start:440 stop:1129 length:690 start_codon:yes stop_codon:yes gene_type:complete
MSEFFLELFSEQIPAKLQINARKSLFENFRKFLEYNEVSLKGKLNVFSTPNRLVLYADKIAKNITKKKEEIRGPSTKAPYTALEGFIRANKINKNKVFKKNTEKGEFYFFKQPTKKINTKDLITKSLPSILDGISWNKSMKWGSHDLSWGRPLKLILSVYDGKKINFDFHHLKSSNFTYIDKDFEEKTKKFNSFKSYNSYLKSIGVIIDQNKRKSFIRNELIKISKKKI